MDVIFKCQVKKFLDIFFIILLHMRLQMCEQIYRETYLL